MHGLSLPGDALAAAERIAPYVRRTPLDHSPYFSERAGANVYLKLENLQYTGSFKLRGAFNKLLSLSEEERAAGCIAASSGNHGAALAFAFAKLGVRGTIYVPEATSSVKIDAIRRAGAEVACAGDTDAYNSACAPAIYAAHSAQFTAEADERWRCDGVDNDCDGAVDEACCLNGDLAARVSAGTRHTLNLETQGRPLTVAPALASALPGHTYTAVSAASNQLLLRLLDAQGVPLAELPNLSTEGGHLYKQVRLLPVEDGHLLLALSIPQSLASQPRHKQYGRLRQWHISADGQTRRVEQDLWDANIIDFDADIVGDRVAIAALRRGGLNLTSAIVCQQQRAPMQALAPCIESVTHSLDTSIQAASPINVKLGPNPGQTAVAWSNIGYRIWEGSGQAYRYEEPSIGFYMRDNPLNPTPKVALAWFNGRLLALASSYVSSSSISAYEDTEQLWLLVPSLEKGLVMGEAQDVNPSGHTDHQPSMVADEEGVLMTWSAPGQRVMARVDRSLLTDASLNTQDFLFPAQTILSASHTPLVIASGAARSGEAAKASTTSGCRIAASTPPSRAPARMVGSGGALRKASQNTATRGSSVQSEMLNVPASVSCRASMLSTSESASTPKPTARNRISEMMNEGPVVHAMCRMCSKISEPATAGARLVVSESGDILSPK